MKARASGPILLAAVLFIALEAMAHIPAPSFMLDRLAQQRTKMGYRRLKVTMQCGQEGADQQEQILYLKAPGKVRRERAGGTLEICAKGKCWLKKEGTSPEQQPAWAFLPYLYFVEYNSQGSRYLNLLKSLKINTRVDTITRFHSRMAIVYGAKQWERDRPQFWMDKDEFLPFRLMVKEGSSLVDILWIGWGSKTGGDWFPSVLEVRLDGKTLERCEVSDVQSGVSMPEDMFKI